MINVNKKGKVFDTLNNTQLYLRYRTNNNSYNSTKSDYIKNESKNYSDNNKITFIYDGKEKKRKSLPDIKDINKIIDNDNNSSDNINDDLNKNLGKVLKKIIIKENKKKRIKRVILSENNIDNLNKSNAKNYCKTETQVFNKKQKNERKIKKSNSITKVEKNYFTIKNNKAKSIPPKKKHKYEIQICDNRRGIICLLLG